LYQAVLADARFHEQLLVFDRDLSAAAQAGGCGPCGGALHAAPFGRKPRGGPAGLSQDYARRFSFCCSVDGCRKRMTPPSLRFLGRKVYLATVVTLIAAMLHGTTPARLTRLSIVPGIDRRTLARWRAWWLSTFTGGPFALIAPPSCRRSTSPACQHRCSIVLPATSPNSSPPCSDSLGP
jgi:hypothetical protein